jgi:hypothetical protein
MIFQAMGMEVSTSIERSALDVAHFDGPSQEVLCYYQSVIGMLGCPKACKGQDFYHVFVPMCTNQ